MERTRALRVFGLPVFTLTETVSEPSSPEEDEHEPFGFHGGSGGTQESRWSADTNTIIDAG
jgi:hypothetical protein